MGIKLLALPWQVVGVMLAGDMEYYQGQQQALTAAFVHDYLSNPAGTDSILHAHGSKVVRHYYHESGLPRNSSYSADHAVQAEPVLAIKQDFQSSSSSNGSSSQIIKPYSVQVGSLM